MQIQPVDIRRSDAEPLAKGGKVGNGLNRRSAESATVPRLRKTKTTTRTAKEVGVLIEQWPSCNRRAIVRGVEQASRS